MKEVSLLCFLSSPDKNNEGDLLCTYGIIKIGLAGVLEYLIPLHQQRDLLAEKACSRVNAVILFFKNMVSTEIVHFTQEDAITFQLSCKAAS